MPGGGLFSTATDVAIFRQMLMTGGRHQGKQIISEASAKEMPRRQTAPELRESYRFGLLAGPGSFGHGGAFATNMTIDAEHGIITLFMVQHAGFPGNGKENSGVFKAAAVKASDAGRQHRRHGRDVSLINPRSASSSST
jgi:CubicO group peptidase (beta-lactamase class C family)